MLSLDAFLTALKTLPGHDLAVDDALRIVLTIGELVPLLVRGRAQRFAPRGRSGVIGAWFALAADLFTDTIAAASDLHPSAEPISLNAKDLEDIAEDLHFFDSEDHILLNPKLLRSLRPPTLLISPRINCLYCSTANHAVPVHFRKRDRKDVRVILPLLMCTLIIMATGKASHGRLDSERCIPCPWTLCKVQGLLLP